MPSALDLNLGAILIGALLGSVLFGAVTVQVYVYLQSPFNDTKWIQSLVVIIWVAECVWTIATWIYLYHIIVTNYGDLDVLERSHWALVMTPIISGMVEMIVQGFFAYRIWVLSGRRIIPAVVSVITATQLAGCFVMGILAGQLSLPVFASRFKWVITFVFSLTLSADLINTMTMCYYLRLNRRGITSTNRALDTLCLWTIQTGILLSITAMLILIFEQTLPRTEMWIGVALIKGKLYSNNFMASLNGRNFLRQILDNTSNTLASSGPALSTFRVDVQKSTYHEQVGISAMGESPELLPI
ncbi:hypothetical protein AB1N83_012400 [Pleurotus pulmonarius]